MDTHCRTNIPGPGPPLLAEMDEEIQQLRKTVEHQRKIIIENEAIIKEKEAIIKETEAIIKEKDLMIRKLQQEGLAAGLVRLGKMQIKNISFQMQCLMSV